MKPAVLSFFFLIVFQSAFAQYENFDLSKYRLPEMKRQSLELQFYSAGSGYNQLSNSPSFGIDSLKDTYSRFSTLASGNYTYYLNSERWQINGEGFTSFSFNRAKREMSNSNDYDDSRFENSLQIQYDFRYYFQPVGWFLEMSPLVSHSNTSVENIQNDKWSGSTLDVGLSVGTGIGRIERVEDFRHAILLLQEIDKRGLLHRQLSEDEVVELAILISELENQRFFDSRKRLEAELNAVDGFLQRKNAVGETGIDYFSGLLDLWVYGALQTRESGKQLQFSVEPLFDRVEYGGSSPPVTKTTNTSYLLEYSARNPISVKWQFNYDVGLSHLKKVEKEDGGDYSLKQNFSQAFVNLLVGYYPNTRTYFTCSSELGLQNQSGEKALDDDHYSATFNIATNAYYYISERLRLSGSLMFRHDKSGLFRNVDLPGKKNTFDYRLNLSYAIF